MTKAIISAVIIAVVGPFVGSLITYYLTSVLPSNVYPIIPSSLQTVLNGKWSGNGFQKNGPERQPIDHTIALTLKCGKRKITGDATIHVEVSDKKYIMYYKVEGIFFEDRVLSFTYRNTDAGVRQYGSAVLELDSYGRKLKGLIIGYGFLSQTIVEVDVELRKDA